MSTTTTKRTVSEIAKLPPLRNIRKTSAEATVKKFHIENTLAQLHSPPAVHETTVIDLVDTSDDIQQQPQLTVDPNCGSFGQAIVILSSDSQESNTSCRTASIHSFPSWDNTPAQMSPMNLSPPISSNNPDTSEHSLGDRAIQESSQNTDSSFRRGECGQHQAHTATKN